MSDLVLRCLDVCWSALVRLYFDCCVMPVFVSFTWFVFVLLVGVLLLVCFGCCDCGVYLAFVVCLV